MHGGLLGHHRGLDNQNKFLFAMENLPEMMRPFWLRNFREATRLEDRKGFDAYAELDVGGVPIQIKSSMTGADKHLRHYPNFNGVVVIMHDDVSDTDIRRDTIDGLRQWRAEVLFPMRRWRSVWMPLFTFSMSARSHY